MRVHNVKFGGGLESAHLVVSDPDGAKRLFRPINRIVHERNKRKDDVMFISILKGAKVRHVALVDAKQFPRKAEEARVEGWKVVVR